MVSMERERWERAAARLVAARSLASARAWKVQRVGWLGDWSMRQRRPEAVWCWQSCWLADLLGIVFLLLRLWCAGRFGIGDDPMKKTAWGTPLVFVKQCDSLGVTGDFCGTV
jgi:hypothetical protein